MEEMAIAKREKTWLIFKFLTTYVLITYAQTQYYHIPTIEIIIQCPTSKRGKKNASTRDGCQGIYPTLLLFFLQWRTFITFET
jgi:hypothetical protein